MTRRVRLFVAASLDGRIAGPGGEIDWLFADQDYGYTEFFRGVDTLLMGRRTYETALGFDPWPNAGKTVVVFSRRGIRVATPDTLVTDRAPVEVVEELRRMRGLDLWLVGGGELVRAFLDADLVDTLDVAIHPLVLGAGAPLFPPSAARTALALTGVQHWDSGLVMLKYARA